MFQVNPLLARQRIDMKNQALFSLKDKCKKVKCHLLQILYGALRVNTYFAVSDLILRHFFLTFIYYFFYGFQNRSTF